MNQERREVVRAGVVAAVLLVCLGVVLAGSPSAGSSLSASSCAPLRSWRTVEARHLPLARLAGQSIVSGMNGTAPGSRLLARIRCGEIGGVILFASNIATPDALARTIGSLQRVARAGGNPPLLIAVDQEGGTVKRLPEGPPATSAADMGRLDDPGYARREGKRTALYLRSLGITVDLAPVLDVPRSPSSFLGTRAFGRAPGLVARVGSAFAKGLQDGDVAATVKHFPGLGNTSTSTDGKRVVIRASKSRLNRELLPFRDAIADGVKLVMVSNASYPAFDGQGRPALLSPPVARRLLREQLGFHGVAITDSMEAPWPASVPNAASRAVAAGMNLLLYTSEAGSRSGFHSLMTAARRDPLLQARLQASYGMIRSLKLWLLGQRVSPS